MDNLIKQISDRLWVIQAATNTGIVKLNGEECLLIDPGGDKDNAKYILKILGKLGLKPAGVLVTHAHADHYGACAYLQKNVVGIEFFASPFESSLMEQPLLEPIFLYGGAEPIKELTHKFILAKPVAVSAGLAAGNWEYRGNNFQIIDLPGHSTGQIGLVVEGLLFCGDALMLSEYIRKFKFPFYSNIAAAFQSLNFIFNSDYPLIIPGHGPVLEPDAYRREADFAVANLKEIIEIAYSQLKAGPLTMERLLQEMARKLEIRLATPIQYVLDRTLVLAIVNYLAANNRAEHYFEDNLWYWKAIG